mgnify:CR=1 FL=1
MPVIRKFRNIESTGKIPKGKKERYVSVAETMILHKRFMKLSANAVKLYLYMKYWSAGIEEIEFSATLAKEIMSKPTFFKARDELVKNGFLEITNNGKFNHTTNKYKFSAKWHEDDDTKYTIISNKK